MCYFITIAIPIEKDEILASNKTRGIELSRTLNESIIKSIPNGYSAFLLTSGMCSCDLFAEEQEGVDKQKLEASLRKRYTKKGWSKSKIDRAISQSTSSAEKTGRYGLRDDIIFFICSLCNEIGTVYFIAHWYKGDTETERIPVKGEMSLSTDQVQGSNSINMADIVYKIKSVG